MMALTVGAQTLWHWRKGRRSQGLHTRRCAQSALSAFLYADGPTNQTCIYPEAPKLHGPP